VIHTFFSHVKLLFPHVKFTHNQEASVDMAEC